MAWLLGVIITALCLSVCLADDGTIVIDDAQGIGRYFDGIGGLSGGGATSKLLVNYPQKQRDEILDYLFKPNFGASLHILKVEIGGDAQSTDGTEASHMHYSWEENYQRGYEWWLMKEAKKRNPDIILYALPWGFPGWVGAGSYGSPYTNRTQTADYIVKWIQGAYREHGLTIDFVGIWNERNWDAEYVEVLRSTLDSRGYQATKIVVGDGDWDPADYIAKNPDFAKQLYAIGCHYPGTFSNPAAIASGSQLWSSEDFSTFNDETGGGCWARILNQNYVTGFMTSTISWNLIASYYKNLPFYRDGLMTAVQPWSGNYSVETPIWISAHTTQFTKIGWYYLKHGSGVGRLPKGGSIVTLVSPDFNPFHGQDMTIVIETMTHDHSGCIRPGLPPYTVEEQTITLQLEGIFKYSNNAYNKLNISVWYSKLGFNGAEDIMFQKKDPLVFSDDGKASLKLGLDEIWTITTVQTGQKGNYPSVPASQPFPLPYTDDFEGYNLYQEPYNLAQQIGSFEVLTYGNNKFARQMMLETTVRWCDADNANKTLSIIGDDWSDIFVETSFELPLVNASTGVFVAARVDKGGCASNQAQGIFFFATPEKFIVSSDLLRQKVLTSGSLNFKPGEWHNISLLVENNQASGAFDGKGIFNVAAPATPTSGFAAIGTDSFGLADFDKFKLDTKKNGKKIMSEYFKSEHYKQKPLFFVSEKN